MCPRHLLSPTGRNSNCHLSYTLIEEGNIYIPQKKISKMEETLESDLQLRDVQSRCMTDWIISFQFFFHNKIIVDHSNRTCA